MSATILTIDVGNSRSHWGVFTDGSLVAHGNLTSRGEDLDFRPLLQPGGKYPTPDGIMVCSVVPRVSEILRQQSDQAGIRCEFLTHERVGSLKIHYPNPSQLGPDRLANALGGLLHAEPPFIVIDMGTAVTLDAVTAANGYEGGIIAPGFAFLSEYLSEKTALLPPIDMTRIHRRTGIGRSTEEAMEVGCTKGFAGMIRELVATTTEEILTIDGREPKVLVTGGSFTWVKESWIGGLPFYPHLTLEGVLSRAPDLLGLPIGRSAQ
ncbi:MAG: type III pantothenate kinase [Puniceicoccales bacterium]